MPKKVLGYNKRLLNFAIQRQPAACAFWAQAHRSQAACGARLGSPGKIKTLKK
jgi:hypothetical protein